LFKLFLPAFAALIGRGGGQHPVDQANKGRYLVWKKEGKPINTDDVCLALIFVTYFRVGLCVAIKTTLFLQDSDQSLL
jgi:hypothetical protein